jgi:hypothetical protein
MATRGIPLKQSFIAWDTANNIGKTGDAANITMQWIKDGILEALDTPTVTEISDTLVPGLYSVDLSSAETDANNGTLGGASTTADVSIIPASIQFQMGYVESGLAQIPFNATTIKLENNTQTANLDLTGMVVVIVSGTGKLQTRRIDSYNSGTQVATVDRDWDVNPDATSKYHVLGLIL